MYKEFIKFNNKENNPFFDKSERSKLTSTPPPKKRHKDGSWLEYGQEILNPLCQHEIANSETMKCWTPIRKVKTCTLVKLIAAKNVEQQEFSPIAGRKCKMAYPLWEDSFLQNLKYFSHVIRQLHSVVFTQMSWETYTFT